MNLIQRLNPSNYYKPLSDTKVLVERTEPYRFINCQSKPASNSDIVGRIKNFTERFFQKIYCFYFNSIVSCFNKLKLYKFEKKPQFFTPTKNQTQLITSYLLLPYLIPNSEHLVGANNYRRTTYAFEPTSRDLKKNSMFIPTSSSKRLIISFLRQFQSFRLLDICMTTVESYSIIKKSIQGLKESKQLYKINNTIAIQAAIAHLATFVISLHKIHQTINTPYYINLIGCSRVDETKLEALKNKFESEYKENTHCPEQAYIKELDAECPDQAVQILDPHKHLEDLSEKNLYTYRRKILRKCHQDKGAPIEVNRKINEAFETLLKKFQ